MQLGRVKITAALATAFGVATPSLAFVTSPAVVQTRAALPGSPLGILGETGSSGKTRVVVRSWTCWQSEKPHPQEQRQGGCSFMMASEAPPGEGKFVKMGGAEDVQSFGPRQASTKWCGSFPSNDASLDRSTGALLRQRCILASGLSFEESNAVLSILEDLDQDQQDSTPFVVLTPEIADKRVGDVLTDATVIGRLQKRQGGTGDASTQGTTPVIVFSGFANSELKNFAARFRSETGVRAAFAKAVPNAMTKSVARLCGEIGQDHADAIAGKLHGSKD